LKQGPRIILDFDNTLVDTDARVLSFLQEEYKTPINFNRSEEDYISAFSKEFLKSHPTITSSFLTSKIWSISQNEIFAPNKVKPKMFAKMFVKELKDMQAIITVATANPLPAFVIGSLKATCIYNMLDYLTFCFDSKDNLSCDFLVDDMPTGYFVSGRTVIRIKTPFNRHIISSSFVEADDLTVALKEIKERLM
jgi:hypothetical protein